ncbi:MFS general substrate transporter [Fistulina hepatica ATCC 64428]|uniref:MFS general substrate transporter n=1 Tax=Fistulina hepatica ATCC 64428 TaxID=1128425 RepID=A0A0D7AM15_9AGAR|nr:MFS general substrate transporter [Fistulina hepatica ATCC 64428]
MSHSTSIETLAATGQAESTRDLEKDAATVERAQETENDWGESPDNPRNWPRRRKWVATFIVSFYAFLSPLGSSLLAPGLPQIDEQYNITNDVITSMILSIFLLSFAFGSVIFPPLSEIYGRTWPLHISNLVFMVFNLGCAFAPSANALLIFRFLCGFPAAGPVSIGGGSISDLFAEDERAGAMAVYTLGPLMLLALLRIRELISFILGPIIGGYTAQYLGMKYVFIINSCLGGLAALVGIPCLRETYGPLVRMQKEQKDGVSRALGPPNGESKTAYLWHTLCRPIILLFRSLTCFMLSTYMALLYGIYYLMVATFADFFSETYGFKAGAGGLCYLGLGLGFVLATLFGAQFGDSMYNKRTAANGGVGKPEFRMPGLIFGSFFIPVSLWYGWSAQAKLHWIMPIIGTGIFGFADTAPHSLPILLYLVDTFQYAASAFGAATVFRCLSGFAFPLFASQMYDALGMGLGNSLLGAVSIVLGIPFPIYLYLYGEQIRARSPYARH